MTLITHYNIGKVKDKFMIGLWKTVVDDDKVNDEIKNIEKYHYENWKYYSSYDKYTPSKILKIVENYSAFEI